MRLYMLFSQALEREGTHLAHPLARVAQALPQKAQRPIGRLGFSRGF